MQQSKDLNDVSKMDVEPDRAAGNELLCEGPNKHGDDPSANAIKSRPLMMMFRSSPSDSVYNIIEIIGYSIFTIPSERDPIIKTRNQNEVRLKIMDRDKLSDPTYSLILVHANDVGVYLDANMIVDKVMKALKDGKHYVPESPCIVIFDEFYFHSLGWHGSFKLPKIPSDKCIWITQNPIFKYNK